MQWRLLALFILFIVPINIHAQEICDNCVDDDGDGLVDCYDTDCCQAGFCNAFFACQPPLDTSNGGCYTNETIIVDFELSNLWANDHDIDTRKTVVAGDVDNDGVTEALVIGRNAQGLLIINGTTGQTEHIVNTPDTYPFTDAPALADVDRDGYSEIYIVTKDRRMLRYQYDGSNWQQSSNVPGSGWSDPRIGYATDDMGWSWCPNIADFNADGIPEVYLGNQIYNSLTGAKITQAPGGINANNALTAYNGVNYQKSAYPAVADFLPDTFCNNCSGLEIALGNEVYAVDVSGGTMTLEASVPDNIIATGNADGPTSTADFDNDGLLDVVVNGAGGWIYVWNPRTSSVIRNPAKIPNTIYGGHPSIADFDNDGLLEVGVAGSSIFVVFDNDLSILWSDNNVIDRSQMTTASVYDFDGDGASEVAYLDEAELRVYDGATGNLKGSVHCGSGTRTNFPTIVDINGDGQVNIVCPCGDSAAIAANGAGVLGVIKAWRTSNFPWIGSRKVMNQHSYFTVNVEDDLTICAEQQNHANIPILNKYLSQTPLLDKDNNVLPLPVADIITVVDSVVYDCADSATVHYSLCNQGLFRSLPGIPVSFYRGDPMAGAMLITTIHFPGDVAKDSCVTLTQTLDVLASYDLHIVANDSGYAPLIGPVTAVPECDSTNNLDFTPLKHFAVDTLVDNNECFGENQGAIYVAVLDGVSPYNFSWQGSGTLGSSASVNNLVAGNYNLTLSDGAGCNRSFAFTISEPPLLEMDTAVLTNYNGYGVSCFDAMDGGIDITVIGGVAPYAFEWSNGNLSEDLVNAGRGNHSVTVTDANGCTLTEAYVLTWPDSIQVTSIANDALCFGDSTGSVLVGVIGGLQPFTYSWNNGTVTKDLQNVPAGTYILTITDSNNCTKAITEVVDEPDLLQIASTNISDYNGFNVSCNGSNDGRIDLTIMGGTPSVIYEWSDGQVQNPAANLSAGGYNVTVTDNNGCTVTGSYMLNEPDSVKASLTFVDVSCYDYNDGSIIVSAQGGTNNFTFQWNTPSVGNNSAPVGLAPAFYTITVSDDNGCTYILSQQITEPGPVIVTLDSLFQIRFGEEVEMPATVNKPVLTYEWNPPFLLDCTDCSNPIASPVFTTTYTVTAWDTTGCPGEATTIVEVDPDKILFVPNAFSPNGDGINDVFEIYTRGTSRVRLSIFNRWGELVFESTDLGIGWDGTFKGELMNPGVYVYDAYLEYRDRTIQRKKGSLLLQH